MSSAYRSAYDHIVGLKRDEVREAREQLAPMLPELREINRARWARIVSGLSGVGAAIAMVWYAATATHRDENATYSLVFGFVGLGVTWALARILLFLFGQKRTTSEPELTGQLERDVELLDVSDVRREVRAIEAQADKLEIASIALPIAGITFLAPLFLHWLVACVMGNDSAREYSEWIRISLVIVGHAHIALAVLGYLFARKLHRATNEAITNLRIHREWAKIWLITIGVSCLPGIVLLLVPPLLVALTGIAFIPFMIAGLRHSILNERLLIARAFAIGGMQNERAYWELEPVRPVRMVENVRVSAEEQQREPDRDDEHADADARDRAQA